MYLREDRVLKPSIGLKDGWHENGIFRRAHEKVIEMILDKCKNIDEENRLYELLFEREVAKLRAAKYEKQLYYEDAKVREARKRQKAGAKIRTKILDEKDDYEAERKLFA